MTYFTNINSLDELKNHFRSLALQHHPDRGGNTAVMQAINNEYDILFPIWKAKYNSTAATPTDETARSTRSEFYTQYGWKGENYDSSLPLKEIAVLVRKYIKRVYPTWKFSVTTSYASMCQELHVALMEAPYDIYKKEEDWSDSERYAWDREELKMKTYHYTDEQMANAKEKFIYTELAKTVIDDVNQLVNSYNYDDSDAMIDYFDNNFYYFKVQIGKWDKPFKVVPKTARIEETKTSKKDTLSIKSDKNYTIVEDIDTRDESKIWIVKFADKLSKDEFKELANVIRSIKGYYSRFKHGFLFKYEPTKKLREVLEV